MSMQVNAPLVTVMTENGRVQYLYRGDTVPKDATKESVDNLKSLGFVTSDEVDPVMPVDGDDEGEKKPARRSSSK